MPFPHFAAAAAATLPAAACAVRGGALPSPAGVAASAGSSAGEAAPAGGAASLAAAPAGFLPLGAAATGAAALRCLSPRCCPAAPLPAGSVAAGASTERAPSPAGRKPAASRSPAGYCRHSACACAGAVLPGCGCRCRWLQACRSRAATVAALPRFCVNDFDVNILPKHNTRSSKTNHSHEQPGSDTTVGKSLGGDIICAAEEQENKNPRFPKRCSSSCEDWCAKIRKTQNCV